MFADHANNPVWEQDYTKAAHSLHAWVRGTAVAEPLCIMQIWVK